MRGTHDFRLLRQLSEKADRQNRVGASPWGLDSLLRHQYTINYVYLQQSMEDKKIEKIKDAQALVKTFAERNNWKDIPNVDKFDHLHEELIEMSQHLRYKSEEERIKLTQEKKDVFVDGIGDLFFGLCRLANQLGVDIEEAFNLVKKEILAKYNHKNPENNITR